MKICVKVTSAWEIRKHLTVLKIDTCALNRKMMVNTVFDTVLESSQITMTTYFLMIFSFDLTEKALKQSQRVCLEIFWLCIMIDYIPLKVCKNSVNFIILIFFLLVCVLSLVSVPKTPERWAALLYEELINFKIFSILQCT